MVTSSTSFAIATKIFTGVGSEVPGIGLESSREGVGRRLARSSTVPAAGHYAQRFASQVALVCHHCRPTLRQRRRQSARRGWYGAMTRAPRQWSGVIGLPAGLEALENMWDAADVGQEFALQAGRRVGRKIYFDRISEAAEPHFNGAGDLVIGAAGGEDTHDFIRDFGRHLAPAACQRHGM